MRGELHGRVLDGRYEVGTLLGTGRMAQTYLGAQLGAGRQVAIKFLLPELTASRAMRIRFRQEVNIASHLRHPNIAAVLDAGSTDDGIPYMVMELAHGRPLSELIARDAPLTLPRVWSIVAQLLAALEDLHARGVVHGDVRSENVMLDTLADGRDVVKLVDFGLAHRLTGTIRPRRATVAGTPEYVAPEVIRGEESGAPADVYGAGAILYELLTGEPPFSGDSPQELIYHQLRDPVVPPSLGCRGRLFRPELDDLVVRALDKDPARRPRPLELRTTLERLLRATSDELSPSAGTQRWRLPHGAAQDQALRARIHSAVQEGDLEEASTACVELVARRLRDGQMADGLAEITVAIELLTGGRGTSAPSAPSGVWRLLLLRARLLDAAGRRESAHEAATHALRFAARSGLSHKSRHWQVMVHLSRS
jgi:serine/threonine protein kinase